MIDLILKITDRYAEGLKGVLDRRSQWLNHHKEVRDHLKEIAAVLNEKASYKPNYFVDTNHAFSEEINGTCANLPSLTFRCGEMPLDLSFKNAMGERKEYTEQGFYITFTPVITGQIIVLLLPHYSPLIGEKPEYINIAVIDHPENLTPDAIDQIIARGMEMAYYSSFTGMMDQQKLELHEQENQRPHTPIGFKRYESTEKVK